MVHNGFPKRSHPNREAIVHHGAQIVEGFQRARHYGRSVNARLGADEESAARAPRLLAVDVEGERPDFVAQRGEIEVLADARNLSRVAAVPLDTVFGGDTVHFLRRFVDDIDPVFRLLVGQGEVAALHNVYPHEPQEVPRDGIDLPMHLLAFERTVPRHATVGHKRAVAPGNLLDRRIRHQLAFHSVAIAGKFKRQVRLQQTFLIESHIVLHHETMLLVYEYRADNQHYRDGELQPDQPDAESFTLLVASERTSQSEGRVE